MRDRPEGRGITGIYGVPFFGCTLPDRSRRWPQRAGTSCRSGIVGGVARQKRRGPIPRLIQRGARTVVAIIRCHSKGKGNKVSQHLLPTKRRQRRVVAKPVVFAPTVVTVIGTEKPKSWIAEELATSLDFWKFASYPRPTACQASRLSEILHECGRRQVWVSQRPYPGGRPRKSVFFVKGH